MFLNKRFIVTGLLVVFSVFFLGFFSQSDKVNPIFQTLLVSVTFFLVVPVLYSKIVLQESLKNMGWQEGRSFLGALTATLCVAVALGGVFVLSRFTPLSEEYLFPVLVQKSFFWFFLYEAVLVSLMTFLYEVFFRGLIQLSWLRSFGFAAVFLQAAIFVGLLYLSGDISWQRAPLILFSPLAGIVAYFSRSLWYSWGASWVFFFLTDVFLLVGR